MNIQFCPSIDIIMGPMLSGKTSDVIRRLIIYHEMEMKVLYVNHTIDTRSNSAFSTHNATIGKIPFDSVKISSLDAYDVCKYDVIAIDEAQFFTDLKDTVLKWVEEQKKIVIVAGLNGDFRRHPFGQINDLVPYCDTITKLTPFCLVCRKKGAIKPALFSKRIVKSDSDVLIGGKEVYSPTCRECFLVQE
jgi:thymidine kinase